MVKIPKQEIESTGIKSNTAKDGSGSSYYPLLDTDGHLQVDVLSGGGAGSQYTEGDTDATITGTAMMAEGPSDTLTPLQVDSNKLLQVDIAADSVGIGGGTQYNDGDARGTATGTLAMGDDGTNIQSLKCDANGVLAVQDNGSTLSVDDGGGTISIDDNGGSITVDGSVSIGSALPSGTNTIGNVNIASALPAGTNNIGDVDVASLPSIPAGANIIGAVKKDVVNYTIINKHVSSADATGGVTVWDPTAGKKFVVTDLIISTDTAMTVTVKDGATNIMVLYLAANGGAVSNFQTPLQSSTADNNLSVTASTSGNIAVTATGYEV